MKIFNTLPLVTACACFASMASVEAVTITIDSITRTVTTQVTGGALISKTSNLSGTFDEQASSSGADNGTAMATQSTTVESGETLSLYTQTNLLASGSRGSGFAPVSLNSESLVSVNFTVPQAMGESAFWLGGSATVIGGASDGAPHVGWSLVSNAPGGSDVFRGSNGSHGSLAISETGSISAGSYELQLRAAVGSAGPGGFIGSDAQGAAALQRINFVVSPISQVPEPSSAVLALAGLAVLIGGRRRKI